MNIDKIKEYAFKYAFDELSKEEIDSFTEEEKKEIYNYYKKNVLPRVSHYIAM